MESTTLLQETFPFRIVCDERCGLVRGMAALIKWWDAGINFVFVNRDSKSIEDQKLISQLDTSPWSLLLFDDTNVRWDGPDAIPILLKNLPFGKIACVFYILPGTMWLTRQLYLLVSQNKQHFVQRHSI